MANDELIQTDHPLNEAQRNTLDCLLALIIPPSEDGKMPGAADVGFLEYLLHSEAEFLSPLTQVLDAIIDTAKTEYGKPFIGINRQEQENLVHSLRRSQEELFNQLTILVMTCYYQDDKVMTGIGLEARPPFPKGHQLETGDLSLLAPVKQRGEFWRKV